MSWILLSGVSKRGKCTGLQILMAAFMFHVGRMDPLELSEGERGGNLGNETEGCTKSGSQC